MLQVASAAFVATSTPEVGSGSLRQGAHAQCQDTAVASEGASLRRLSSQEIRSALIGMFVSYSPPGSADSDVHEEYHPEGKWSGVRYQRAADDFSGRWWVEDGRLCVAADDGLVSGQLREGTLCRVVWRDTNGSLLMEHAMQQREKPLLLSVRSLKSVYGR